MKKNVILLFTALMLAWPAGARANRLQMDVNGDGSTDIEDVTALIGFLLGQPAGDTDLVVTDVNGDGMADIVDVTDIIAWLLCTPIPQTHEVTITVNGVEFTMVYVEGGTFTMGATEEQAGVARRNEYPPHEVTLSSYYIGKTEVTQELWVAVAGGNPSYFQGDLQRPIENVSMFNCAKFVDQLSELTGKVFRLPTEAEWEFAARGGNLSQHFRYAGSDDVKSVAWYEDVSDGAPHAVALLAPNELGLYDMCGNVCEWCQDWYYMYDGTAQVNPVGPESGNDNVVRGGSFFCTPNGCRVSTRYDLNPYERTNDLGLRLVMNE